MKLKNLENQVFGRLTVIKQLESKGKHLKWLCKCECGNEKIAISTNLQQGKTKSCGCLRNEIGSARLKTLPRKTYDLGIGSAHYLWNRYKQTAKKKNRVFELDKDIFIKLTSSNCSYCNFPPCLTVKGPRSNGEYKFNGIDRKDTSIGYTTTNSVPCCHFCNQAKNAYSFEEFITWLNFIRGKNA